MNRVTINVLNIAIAATLATGLSACNRSADAGPAGAEAGTPNAEAGVNYAKVVSVKPVHKTINHPKQVCHDETVTHTAPPKDKHQIAGTAIGAIAGGLLGNQVGGGDGKKIATVAGAIGGGYVGNKIQERHQNGQVTTSVERECTTVNNTSTKVVGYDVGYVYKGVTRTVRMDHDPGDRVEVQEGVTAVSDAR